MTQTWPGTALFLVLLFISIGIRVPHDRVSRATQILESRKGALEKCLMGLIATSILLLPLLSLTPVFSFADYAPGVARLVLGTLFMQTYLWLFHRSHADLGRNWSASLELRERHEIVEHGVYKRIRHPMYASVYLMAIGQAFLISNWIAGLSSLVSFTLMFFLRLKPEEQMMRDQFGQAYDTYLSRTSRLIPGIW